MGNAGANGEFVSFVSSYIVMKFRAIALSEISRMFGEIVSARGYNEIEPVVDGGLSSVKQTPKLLDEVHALLYTTLKCYFCHNHWYK